jgi:hypothetical protein
MNARGLLCVALLGCGPESDPSPRPSPDEIAEDILETGSFDGVDAVRAAQNGLYVRDRARLSRYSYDTLEWETVVEVPTGVHDIGVVILGPVEDDGIYFAVQNGEQSVGVSFFRPGVGAKSITSVAGLTQSLPMRLLGRDRLLVQERRIVYHHDGMSEPLCPSCPEAAQSFQESGTRLYYRDPRGVVRRDGEVDEVVVPAPVGDFVLCGDHLVVAGDATSTVHDLDGRLVRTRLTSAFGECAPDPDTLVIGGADGLRSERLDDGVVRVLSTEPGWSFQVHQGAAFLLVDGALSVIRLEAVTP